MELMKVDGNVFPLISKILKLLMLIPATGFTVERAYSSLKYDQLIDDFSRRNSRKILLINLLG